MTTSEMSPDQIEMDIERTREDLRNDVDALKEKLSPTQAAKRSAARLGDSVGRAREALMGTAEDGVARTQESMAGVSDTISRGTRGNPVAVGLGAFVLGWLVSSSIPTSRTEQRAAGTLRDSEAAASVVQPIAETARTVAENAGDSAKEAALEVRREAQSAATAVNESLGSHDAAASSVRPQ